MSGVLPLPKYSTPSITVLMSVFNGERWLHEAIASILCQTYSDFEFIIVNDGSTDNSEKIVKQFQAHDSRIILINKTNTGLADSLNQGISAARGEWIARLDSDDICDRTRLEKQIGLARSNLKLIFIGTGLTIIDEIGQKLAYYRYPSQHAELLKDLTSKLKFPAHSSAFYKTEPIRTMGGYRPRIVRSQDSDLWLRLSEYGEMTSLPEPLVQIRHHFQQISHDEGGNKQLLYSRIGLISYWLRRYGEFDPVDDDEQKFQIFLTWVKTQLINKKIYEFYSHCAVLRSLLRSSPKTFSISLRIISICLQHPIHTLNYLKEWIYGEALSRRLALEWIAQK